jgi:hypothetical protein
VAIHQALHCPPPGVLIHVGEVALKVEVDDQGNGDASNHNRGEVSQYPPTESAARCRRPWTRADLLQHAGEYATAPIDPQAGRTGCQSRI